MTTAIIVEKTLGDFFGILPEETCKALEEHTQKARNEWNRSFLNPQYLTR